MASEEGSAEEALVAIPGENKKLDSKEDVEYIVKEIAECEGLTALQLSGNSYGVEAMAAIGEALSHTPLLSKALWSDMFVSRLRTEIPPALVSLGKGVMEAQAQLVELDLSDNAFGPAAVEAITPLLTSPSCFSLKTLRLNNNGLGPKGGSMLSKALLECHQEAQKAGQKLALEVFVCGRNRLEDVGATALAEVFEVLGSLVKVSMTQDGINPEGITALAKAFSKNTNLEVIDLNDNTFTEVGALAMAEVLPDLQKLRVADFGDCLVKPEGARAIAGAIKDGHKQLEELRLSYDELDQDSAMAVLDSLANKDSIKCIDLNGNCFGEDGIELIRESLEAKGLVDALGSLSEDEGLEEEESEGEEEGEEEEEGDGQEGESRGEVSVEREESTSDVSEGTSERIPQDVSEQRPTEQELKTITIEEYLNSPCGDNLLALGENRAQLILNSLAPLESTTSNLQESTCVFSPVDVAALYVKVASCYVEGCPQPVTQAVESTVDVLLEPLCHNGRVYALLNEILVQVGLIKSEDKKFQPVREAEGPLLALRHVTQQEYFPKGSPVDILISFLMKPNTILDPLRAKGTVQQVLQVLHTL